MSKLKMITTWLIGLKHRQGEHNQKRHGWRYGSLEGARRALRAGVSDDVAGKFTPTGEREAYRKTQAKRGGITGWVEELPAKRPYVPMASPAPKVKKPKVDTADKLSKEANSVLGTLKKQYRPTSIISEYYFAHNLRGKDKYNQEKAKMILEELVNKGYLEPRETTSSSGNVIRSYHLSDKAYEAERKAAAVSIVGKPSSGAIKDTLEPQGMGNPLKAKLDETLNAIQSVHRDGDMVAIPILQNSKGTQWGALYHEYTGRPTKMTVSNKSSHPQSTIAHEYGHFIDYSLDAVKSKKTPEQRNKINVAYEKVRQAIKDSAAFGQLRNMLQDPAAHAKTVTGPGYEYKVNPEAKHVSYLASQVECFARAYAQYIGVRSKNASIMEGTRATWGDLYKAAQWEDNDFSNIATAFDDLFSALEWK